MRSSSSSRYWSCRSDKGSLHRFEVFRLEAEVGPQLLEALLELHERLAEALDLLGAERPALDAPHRLALHQLAQQVDHREHERGQALLDLLGVGVDAAGHGVSQKL